MAEKRRRPQRQKFLLWDFDGTLAHRPGQWTDTLLCVLQRAGHCEGLDREVVRPFMNAGFPWHEPGRVREPGQSADDWWRDLQPVLIRACAHLANLDQDRAATLAAQVRSTYLDPAAWVVFDDVVPALEQLTQRGWRHIVLSNHVPELPQLIDRLGLGRHFDAVHTSATMGVEKPHRKAFLHARSLLPRTARVWMIGDNPVADAQGAEAAGIPAILVRSASPLVSRRCASLTEVIDLLEIQP